MHHRIVTSPASHVVIRMHQLPEQSFSFHFELAEVKFERDEADLLIKFANHGKAVLDGFFPPEPEGELPLIVLASGQVVPGEFLCMACPALNAQRHENYEYTFNDGDALVGITLGGRPAGRQNAF